MADMLATPDDIGVLLGLGTALDTAKATLLAEAGTAVVQEACDRPPQRLVLVENDEVELLGDIASWLALPQRPVRSIASLGLDGDLLTEGVDFKRYGARLWRACGWQARRFEPSTVDVIYTHGYLPEQQELQLGRSAVLSLVRGVYDNPEGAIAVRIDDYSASYDKLSAAMDASPYLQKALQRQYGRRFGLARIGG